MRLTLDHVILRAADPATALAELAERTDAPWGAGVGIEVIAAEVPAGLHGYGLGFTADVPLEAASSQLRRAGLKTSPEVVATDAGLETAKVHVHGLLPDPAPMPTFIRPHDTKQRATESLTRAIARIPFVARAIGRRTGSSLVLVAEYRFERRAAAGAGPAVTTVEVGTAGHDWSELPVAPGPLVLDPEGPPGVRRIVFEGGGELRFG